MLSGSAVVTEEALLDENDVAEDISDRDASSVEPDTEPDTEPDIEPDTEPAVGVSNIGTVSVEVEWELTTDDSDVQARADGLSKKAIEDGSDMLKSVEEGQKLWLS